jgi:signal transduction histidine kinase
LKYTERGSVRVQVAAASRPHEPALVQVRVADTGIGIAAEDQQRLFKAFSQVGQPRRATEGAGLGLYLSIRLADLIGGRITYESRPGEGSTFVLTLQAA